jgi:ribosomal protein L37E
MGEKTVLAEETCKRCGAIHVVTYTYAKFGPANDAETANCRGCGERLVRERCLTISVRLRQSS